MAIFMSPIEHTNLWCTGYKIPQGRYIKCGCFIKRDTWSSCDILRLESHRSIHLLGKQSRKILVKESGIRCQIAHSRRPPAHILGSSRTASWFLLRPFVLATYRDENKIVQCIRTDSQVSMHSSSNFMCGDKNSSMDANTMLSDAVGAFSIRDHPVEEPWLSSSSTLSHRVAKPEACNDLADERKFIENLQINFLESNSLNESTLMSVYSSESENTLYAISKSIDTNPKEYHPVEEPWLLEPILLSSDPKANVISSEFQNKDYVKDEQAQSAACDQEQKSPKKALAEEEWNIISQDPTSTVILINASICTMQRIAVLEDGKLVELLLEPVKNNVQCDSVYLGVITKLVPQMGGAFVNIGGPRSSFMDMKSKREPFIFPPIRCHEKEKELNGSMLGELLGLPGVHEDEHNIEDPDEIEDNEMEDDSIEDVGQHNFDDGSDVTEVFRENVNGSVVSNGMGADFGRDLDHLHENKQHQKVQNGGKTFSFDIECDHDSQMSNFQKMEKLKDVCVDERKWFHVQKGTKIIVQVLKEGLGTKGPQLTAYPKLRSRFWVLSTRGNTIGISKKISGVERTRLRVIAKTLQPRGFGLTVRTVAAGQSLEELKKDLEGLLATWKVIVEHAKSAALAADEGVEGAIPVLLHRAMGQTLSVVQDYFNEKVRSMVVDSPRTYYEVTNYLQEIAPDLCGRVELYNKRTPLFDEYNIEEEINTILSKRVPLANGGYLVIEQTEALVSIDVNGGHCMLGQGTSQEKAILDVNLMAARQIAQELRLRDIGGIIVVDFIDMMDDSNKRLVYEEVKKAVEKDRSTVKVSELSRHGLMEITRKRVRPSVTFMISEPCTCCHATGRVEALETSFSKIEHEICRLLAMMDQRGDPENPKSWPRFILRVDRYMCNYLTSGRRTRLAVLSSSLKVWILLKVARGFSRGAFELKPLAADTEFNNQHQPTISVLQTEGGTHTPSKKLTLFPIKKWRTGGK